MKFLVSIISMCTLFCLPLFCQMQSDLVYFSDEFAFGDDSQKRWHTYQKEHTIPMVYFDDLTGRKIKPGAKGALIGFGVGTTAGLIIGFTTWEGAKDLFEYDSESKAKANWVASWWAFGSATSAGIGALIGHLAKDKSVMRKNVYVPNSGEIPLLSFVKDF